MAVLYISRSESRCGACNKGCSPYEESHITLSGWFAYNDNMRGCGATFTEVSSDYQGLPDLVKVIKDMRPDLPYVGWEPK
jgi:hypothetical protein